MRRFKFKPIYSLLLAALAGTASAVNLGNDGTGQVLIYPYYTVRPAGGGNYATYLNVVNHTTDTKALRLRFREGKNGRSVFALNLYLSEGDVWAGAVIHTADGAQLLSADKSCVSPAGGLAASVAADAVPGAFSNAAYVGVSTTQGISDGFDGESSSLDRTREGFFEIIEMGVVTSPAIVNGLKHDASGTPANCGVVARIDASVIDAPRGGLSGGASLINVQAGSDFGYEPVLLEDFYRPAKAGDNLWSAPASVLPDLSQATPVSRMLYLHDSATPPNPNRMVTDVLATGWTQGVDAVSALLMVDSVMNSYVLDAATLSLTDWIVTFPTKHHYISANAPGSSVANNPNGTQLRVPFHNYFWSGGSCDPIWPTLACPEQGSRAWDRNAQTFSGCISGGPPIEVPNFCYAANMITIKQGGSPISNSITVMGSSNRIEFGVSGFQNGWIKLLFMDSRQLIGTSLLTSTAETYTGLPIVGFMAQDFLNTSVTIGGLPSTSAYGGNFNHKYTRTITGGNVRP